MYNHCFVYDCAPCKGGWMESAVVESIALILGWFWLKSLYCIKCQKKCFFKSTILKVFCLSSNPFKHFDFALFKCIWCQDFLFALSSWLSILSLLTFIYISCLYISCVASYHVKRLDLNITFYFEIHPKMKFSWWCCGRCLRSWGFLYSLLIWHTK